MNKGGSLFEESRPLRMFGKSARINPCGDAAILVYCREEPPMQHLPLLTQHGFVDRFLYQRMPEPIGGPSRQPYPRQKSGFAEGIGSVCKCALAEIG